MPFQAWPDIIGGGSFGWPRIDWGDFFGRAVIGTPGEPGLGRKRAKDAARVEQFAKALANKDSAELARLSKKYKGLARQIAAGMWNAELASFGGPGDLGAPIRPGERPLHTTVARGPLRRVATGALRVAGPTGWILTGGSIAAAGVEILTKYGFEVGAAPRPGLPFILSGGPGRAAAAAPTQAAPKRALRRPEIQPVKVTARYIGIPSVIKGAAPKPQSKLGMILGTIQSNLPQLMQILFPQRPPGGGIISPAISPTFNISPFAEPPAPAFEDAPMTLSELTGIEEASVESGKCECPGKPKKRRKRKARDVCYSGRFIERLSGLQKYQKRKVPCRQFNAKLPY